MLSWFDKMEKKVGRYAISNLTLYLLIAYGIGYMTRFLMPELLQWLTLEPGLILKGQIWRSQESIDSEREKAGSRVVQSRIFHTGSRSAGIRRQSSGSRRSTASKFDDNNKKRFRNARRAEKTDEKTD